MKPTVMSSIFAALFSIFALATSNSEACFLTRASAFETLSRIARTYPDMFGQGSEFSRFRDQRFEQLPGQPGQYGNTVYPGQPGQYGNSNYPGYPTQQVQPNQQAPFNQGNNRGGPQNSQPNGPQNSQPNGFQNSQPNGP